MKSPLGLKATMAVAKKSGRGAKAPNYLSALWLKTLPLLHPRVPALVVQLHFGRGERQQQECSSGS